MTSDHDLYFEYLQGRSRLGLLYRKGWLYPRLWRNLKGRVLDVGCGIGDLLRYRSNTVGVDINSATVAWCQNQGLDARLMTPDLLPFSEDTFEGVILDNVLEHLVEPKPLLAEINRVLVQGGILVVGVPGRRGFACDSDHKIFYDEASLLRVMDETGFCCKRVLHMPFASTWLDARLPQYCVYGVFRRE